jgi:hypothetical protein
MNKNNMSIGNSINNSNMNIGNPYKSISNPYKGIGVGNPYPLLQPPQLPSVLTYPFNAAGNAVTSLTSSALLKGLTATIQQELSKNFGALSQFMNDNEIKYLISQLIKDFLSFFGDIIKEVGTDATNEFLQIFFQMLLDAGKKMINGFANVAIGLLMSAVAEIPVAGGIADVVITMLTTFNDVIGAITPVIRSSVKILTSGAHIFNKASASIFENPALDKMNTNFSKFSAKVFNGLSFFGFLSSMFGSMKNNVSGIVDRSTNALNQQLMNVSANALGSVQDQASMIDRNVNAQVLNNAEMLNNAQGQMLNNAQAQGQILKGGRKKSKLQTKKRRMKKNKNKKKKTKRYRK